VKPYILGWDLGGTKISVVLSDGRRILSKQVFGSGRLLGRDRMLDGLTARSKILLAQRGVTPSKVRGIGISCPGPLDPIKGLVHRSPNLPQLAGFHLTRAIKAKMRLAVRMENDANCAALAESLHGSNRKSASLFYVTVSTGVGGGLVMNGSIWRGASFSAGEIGHVVMDPKGPHCLCGKRGCLEALASGTAIARRGREEVRRGRSPLLRKLCDGKPARLDASMVEQAARRGDPVARRIWMDAAQWLGLGLAQVIQIMNPSVIAVGGGVSKAGTFLLKPVRDAVKQATWPQNYRACRIVGSSLGQQIGDWGAVSLWL